MERPKNLGQAYTSVSNPTFTIDDLEEGYPDEEEQPSTTAVLAVEGEVVMAPIEDRRRLGSAFFIGAFCTLVFVVTMNAMVSGNTPPAPSAATDLQPPVDPILSAHTIIDADDAEFPEITHHDIDQEEEEAEISMDSSDSGDERPRPGPDKSTPRSDPGPGPRPGEKKEEKTELLKVEESKDSTSPALEIKDDGEKSWWKKAWDAIFPEEKHPTKLPGGGRDWLLSAVDGTVSAKSDPTLFLGLAPIRLILVPKDDLRTLRFHPVQSEDGEETEEGSGGWMKIKVGDDDEYLTAINADSPWNILGKFSMLDTVVASDVEPLFFQYKDDNFIATRDGFVLDIASWNIVEGSKVNLFRDDKQDTYKSGGGRDFLWNDEDGTMSPKLNPDLALGSDEVGLILTRNPGRAVHLEHAQDLANTGISVDMEFHLENDADRIYKVSLSEEGSSGDGWRFRTAIASTIDDPDAYVAQITYDGNYVLTSEGNYALDVAYWKMDPFNWVNFVGGTGDD